MEQDVESSYRAVCTTCLSSDRNLFQLDLLGDVFQVFRLLMYDFAAAKFGDLLPDMEQLVCWECVALLRRLARFKRQLHSAQEHLRVLALSRTQETMDHTYMSQSLSSLEMTSKTEYDKIFFDYTVDDWPQDYVVDNGVKNEDYDVVQAVRNNMDLDIADHILEVPQMVLDNSISGVMSHVIVGAEAFVTHASHTSLAPDAPLVTEYTHVVRGEFTHKKEMPELIVTAGRVSQPVGLQPRPKPDDVKPVYVTEYMTEADMLAAREESKKKVSYASAVYKCELCIVGFYSQQQVEEHFVSAHRASPGLEACKICYAYFEESKLQYHMDTHYIRHSCKLCGRIETSDRLISLHVKTHLPGNRQPPSTVIQIGDSTPATKGRKRKLKASPSTPPKPGDLRKLLSKTTIEGYQCLECDMFFKNSRARKNHVARYHREGLQCDHCKKRFVNRTTLATHLRLHEGPLPREECPICHKMVRSIQIKYHIQRHQNKSRFECSDCNKVFSHLATFQAHLKYSRAHASDQVFKFPCPMCNKGYPTKEQMQDHFNYQHLGKTSHKCPICEKPIASRANVDKHLQRVHGEKRDKPRNHTCQQCGKGFTDKKALTQHAVIHSGERPLSCDICQQTFKQKASLYTHRKRVHKLFPTKRVVEFMDQKMEN